jgi:hypothetical protein
MVDARTANGNAERIGLILAIVIPSALVAYWASPRAARPSEMPPLVLPAIDVRRSIAREDALAEQVVDDEREERRRHLYLEHGLREVHADDAPEEAVTRRIQIESVVREIVENGGDDAIAAARARDITRMLPALRATGQDAELDATERASELGLFPSMLARYGAIVDGRRVAPEIVLRTLFAARWNAIHGRPMTEGMDDVRLRAYHGWLALEGGDAPLSMRETALDHYAAAHGSRVFEARGVLLFEAGELVEARQSFARAYELTGSVRLRNHALACEAALAASGLDPALPEERLE